MRSARLAVVLDVACVLVFVIIGRASHGEGLTGVASTAWPFLAGLSGGWLATAGAVALGMLFRVVSGQGTAPAFIGVALAFLGLFLLGWRLLGRLGWLRR